MKSLKNHSKTRTEVNRNRLISLKIDVVDKWPSGTCLLQVHFVPVANRPLQSSSGTESRPTHPVELGLVVCVTVAFTESLELHHVSENKAEQGSSVLSSTSKGEKVLLALGSSGDLVTEFYKFQKSPLNNATLEDVSTIPVASLTLP